MATRRMVMHYAWLPTHLVQELNAGSVTLTGAQGKPFSFGSSSLSHFGLEPG